MMSRLRKPSWVLTVPNSGTLIGPFSENSLRNASRTGTWITIAANRSGRRTSAPPAGMPPALPADAASRAGVVWPSATRCSAQSMKSVIVFCLVSSRPAWCQALPYPPPPRTWAAAQTQPCSSQASTAGSDGESADLIGGSSDPGPAARRRVGQLGPPGQVQRAVGEPLVDGLAQRAVRDGRQHPGAARRAVQERAVPRRQRHRRAPSAAEHHLVAGRVG